jgi:hypothetical protein
LCHSHELHYAALAVLLGCMVGFAVAHKHGKCSEAGSDALHPLKPEQHADTHPSKSSSDGLSPEQRKEVLQGLASLLASALHAKQQPQSDELQSAMSGSNTTASSSSSVSGGGKESGVVDAAGLRQRRNARAQTSAH